MLYSLYKNIYHLDRNEKELLHDSFDGIVSIVSQDDSFLKTAAKIKKEAKNVISKNNIFKQVVARGLHDPETPAEMINLIGLMEKFMGIDNDLSHSNLTVFMSPMSFGARKINLRPCKIVGLMRKLDRLSRKYKREKGIEGSDLQEIKQNFNKNLQEIKQRLQGFKENKANRPKIRRKNKFVSHKNRNRLKNPKII